MKIRIKGSRKEIIAFAEALKAMPHDSTMSIDAVMKNASDTSGAVANCSKCLEREELIPAAPAAPAVPGLAAPAVPGLAAPAVPGLAAPAVPGLAAPAVPGLAAPAVPGMAVPGMVAPAVPGMAVPGMAVPGMAVPGMAAPVAPGMAAPAPPGMAAPAPPDVELDSNGFPWDMRIHGKNKSKNQDGSWRIKRDTDKNLIEQVKAEYRVTKPAETPATNTNSGLPDVAGIVTKITELQTSGKLTSLPGLLAELRENGVQNIPDLINHPAYLRKKWSELCTL